MAYLGVLVMIAVTIVFLYHGGLLTAQEGNGP
jgi:hypothetical protein